MLKYQSKVKFDPSNKEHREIAINFLKNNKWGGPTPFLQEAAFSSVASMVERKLVLYYIEKENV